MLLLLLSCSAFSQDYVKEKRWADDILPTLLVGEPVWLQQKNGHRFLGLLIDKKEKSKGALIIAHGRGWSPDFELYGVLRVKLAEEGYTTLSIQLPVLPSTAILGLYVPLYPDARERFQLAVDFLKGRGHRNIGIVSHSLGATMANQYLIRTDDPSVRAWVSIGILQGMTEMFRVRIPVLDVYGGSDWTVITQTAPERAIQLEQRPGSGQVMVPGATHFFEHREDELVKIVADFLDKSLK